MDIISSSRITEFHIKLETDRKTLKQKQIKTRYCYVAFRISEIES